MFLQLKATTIQEGEKVKVKLSGNCARKQGEQFYIAQLLNSAKYR